MSGADSRQRPIEVHSLRDDPPPFPWLDDPDRWRGPVPIGLALVIGSGLALIGLFALVLGVLGGDHGRVARLVCGVLFVPMGGFIVHMGTARRAWRRRHPGVDPVAVARELGAKVGDPLGIDSFASRVGRWVVVLVCAFVVLISVLSVAGVVTGRSAGSVASVVLVVLLGLAAAFIGAQTLRRMGRQRQSAGREE